MSENQIEATTPSSVRATFAMNRDARDLLRKVAALYGTSQSDVMNNAPFIFLALAEETLKKRRENLPNLEAVVSDALEKLNQMPDYLIPDVPADYIGFFVDLERASLERRQLHGPDTFTLNEDQFYGRSIPARRRNSPFLQAVLGKLQEVGAAEAASAYRQLFIDDDDDDDGATVRDTFSDAEEEATAKARRQETLRELRELGLLDDLPEPTPGANLHGLLSNRQAAGYGRRDRAAERVALGKWGLSMPGKETEADSGGRVLAAFLMQLHDHDPERFERVRAEDIRGRVRPLMADDREKLYPGRPDLAEEYAIEFSPGWWVGTNYSTDDVLRLLKAATRAVGWTWNIDVRLRINGDEAISLSDLGL